MVSDEVVQLVDTVRPGRGAAVAAAPDKPPR